MNENPQQFVSMEFEHKTETMIRLKNRIPIFGRKNVAILRIIYGHLVAIPVNMTCKMDLPNDPYSLSQIHVYSEIPFLF